MSDQTETQDTPMMPQCQRWDCEKPQTKNGVGPYCTEHAMQNFGAYLKRMAQ